MHESLIFANIFGANKTIRSIMFDSFCPSFKKCGFSPADVVDRLRELGQGPKRAYRKLCQRAGAKDHCWPSVERLAADLGKSKRQVLYDIRPLVAYGLIARRRCGPVKSTSYFILRHEIFEPWLGRDKTAT